MPLQRRVPKFGFKNRNRVEYKAINLSTLEELAARRDLDKVDVELLVEAGLVSKNAKVKILAKGQLTRKLDVTAHAFSASARKAIEELKGTVTTV